MGVKNKIDKKYLRSRKECFGFDEEEEFAIYMFLCEGKYKKKTLKKIYSYREWKTYVINKTIKDCKNIAEFSRYLNYKSHCNETFSETMMAIFFPLIVLWFGFFFSEKLLNAFVEFFKIFFVGSESFYIKLIAFTILGVPMLLLMGNTIYSMGVKTIIEFKNSRHKKLFYSDYKEIIDGIIDKQSCWLNN